MSRGPCIHVAAATDAAYVMPLGAMLVSLCRHLDPAVALRVHVVGDRLTDADWSRLQACLERNDTELQRISLDASRVLAADLRTRAFEHISAACFLRLLLPELLPEVGRALVLDCDLIFTADAHALWAQPLDAACFAAAVEWQGDGCTPARLAAQLRHADSLGVPADAPVFNVGVMLADLEAWRQSRLAERVCAYLRAAGAEVGWYEQEALNVCARGRIRTLDPRWNLPPALAARRTPAARGCIHFLTARKPWSWDYDLALRETFFEALDASPWRGWRPIRPKFGHASVLWRRLRKAFAKRAHAWQRRRAGVRDAHVLACAVQHAPRIVTARGTWRVLLLPGEVLRDAQGREVEPAALVAHCEAEGGDAAEAQLGEGQAPVIGDWPARDARDGRLFLGRARVVSPDSAMAPPLFGSRIVVVREGAGVRLDGGCHVIAGARVAPQRLRLTRTAAADS